MIAVAKTMITSRSLGLGFILLTMILLRLSGSHMTFGCGDMEYPFIDHVGFFASITWLPTLIVGLNLLSSRIE